MDTCASSHLNFNASNLSTIFDKRLFSSVHVGDGNSIPVTNTGHSIIPSHHRPLHLHNILVTPNIIKNLISVSQFTRDNSCTIEFDAFGFSVKDYLTRHILLRCDSSGDHYSVTMPSTPPVAFLSTSASTWHQRLRHPVEQICLHLHDPREPHFLALKWILCYVQGTLDFGLQLFSSSITNLVAYSDADWAGCPTTQRLTSGYCVFLGNNFLSWSSKRQPTLSHSSTEEEYHGVANAVVETCWLRKLLHELHTPLSSATLVYCENVCEVDLTSNPVQHQRMKYIEIDIHFVWDLVAQVRDLHVPSRYQYADIFTK
ncbi:ribonuclease H-like domain-containing protein [Tanacetum coccineum]